jgi:NAD-dependent deacetylase
MAIDLSRYRNIVVLTGAGVSAGSGLPTYRGPGGLWEKDDVASLATAEAFRDNPDGVWQLFGGLRSQVRAAQPNTAHTSLARMEELAVGSFSLLTQNVDGLHQRAGSRNVVELHGNIHRTRCSIATCDLAPFDDESEYAETPRCAKCGSLLRPGIVLFGEPLPGGPDHLATRALRDCDLFIAIGTSGTVSPASRFVRSAEYVGAHTVLVNLEPMEQSGSSFKEHFIGKAEELLPQIFLEGGQGQP